MENAAIIPERTRYLNTTGRRHETLGKCLQEEDTGDQPGTVKKGDRKKLM